MSDFLIGDDDFLLDGQPFRILSGALHYFRVHPDLWADRICKARQMGLNTIETYVAWNAHAPTPDTFDTTGPLDLDRFLRLIGDEGMYAIVRPGPYICAEWDNGGLPAWLFRDPTVGVRQNEPQYLTAVQGYLERILGIVATHQVTRGGPVILVQVENEYGAYGDDKTYLTALTEFTRAAGITVPLTTIDQPTDEMLAAGGLTGLHMTASFGSRSIERLARLRAHQPTGPLMCAEFWIGWFDHWGGHHHTTTTEQSATELDTLLATGASVNLYMFNGGTNFGLTNGANDKGVYEPLTTSYDYDAPLDEAGNPTAKYFAFRDVIARHAGVPNSVPPPAAPAPEFTTQLSDPQHLLHNPERWGTWQRHEHLPTLDELGQYKGFALMRTQLSGSGAGVLAFGEVRDRVAVFLDGAPVGVLLRKHHEQAISLPRGTGELTLLVEDQGRVDYGPRIGEPKGLIGGARLDGHPQLRWEVLPIELDAIPTLWPDIHDGEPPASTHPTPIAGPVAVRADVHLDEPVDLFLDTSTWGKGVAWMNGFSLGRYWRGGPQQTLFIPKPILRAGHNTLVLFELEVLAEPTAPFVMGPRLGHIEY